MPGNQYGEDTYEIYKTPLPATTRRFRLPPAPSPDLSYHSEWSVHNAKRIQLAADGLRENENLEALLEENMERSQFNRYNLQVYFSSPIYIGRISI